MTIPIPRPATHDADGWTLVQRAQNGDSAAFGQLYAEHRGQVYGFVYKRFQHRQTAEDITSETFIRAYRKIGTFKWQGKSVGAWFITIARNILADHFKAASFRLVIPVDVWNGYGDVDAINHDPLDNPEPAMIHQFQSDVLRQAIGQLTPAQQSVLTLRFLNGLSIAETALELGLGQSVVKSLQYRGMHTMYRIIHPQLSPTAA